MFNTPIPALLYAMEEDGIINTPRGKRNKFIKDVRSGAYGYLSQAEVRERAASAGFDSYDIEIILQELNYD